jgi:hypothetical protein
MLPIGMGQHEVIEQVGKGHARDGHLQLIHRGKIRSRQSARWVFLSEKDLLGHAVQRLPLPHAPLEGAALGVRILPRMGALQPVPERLGLQAWLELQLLDHRRPDLCQRIRPGPPRPWLAGLTRELTKIAILARRFTIHVRPQCRCP